MVLLGHASLYEGAEGVGTEAHSRLKALETPLQRGNKKRHGRDRPGVLGTGQTQEVAACLVWKAEISKHSPLHQDQQIDIAEP